MQARITGESPCLPPFGEQLIACDYAFLAVCLPNRLFVEWLEQHWLRATAEAERGVALRAIHRDGVSAIVVREVVTVARLDRRQLGREAAAFEDGEGELADARDRAVVRRRSRAQPSRPRRSHTP